MLTARKPKVPVHLRDALGMFHAAGFTNELGERLRHLNMDDAAIELFEFLEANHLNPETMELLSGFCEDDINFIIHSLVIAAYKDGRRK